VANTCVVFDWVEVGGDCGMGRLGTAAILTKSVINAVLSSACVSGIVGRVAWVRKDGASCGLGDGWIGVV
jgi:hypothetical protein